MNTIIITLIQMRAHFFILKIENIFESLYFSRYILISVYLQRNPEPKKPSQKDTERPRGARGPRTEISDPRTNKSKALRARGHSEPLQRFPGLAGGAQNGCKMVSKM